MFFPFSTFSQEDTLSQEIETVTISDKRLQIKYAESSRSIQVIDSEEIEQSPARSIAELLQYVSGVDVRRRGVDGVQADLSIRGGTFDQALVLINGINMSDPQTGHHLMNIPLELQDIERIEILKGPASRRYGQNAFSGAINIVTKKKTEQQIQIGTGYSSNQSGKVRLSASVQGGSTLHQIAVARSFSEGYRYNTDYEMSNISYQSEMPLGEGGLSIFAGHSDRAFGANGFYASPNFTDQYEEIQTTLISAKYEIQKGAWRWMPTIYWRRNQDEYIFVRSNPSLYRNLHIGKTYGAEINGSYLNDWGVMGIGIESRFDDLQSNNLGERSRTTFGMNIEQRFHLLDGRLDITPGIALYTYNDFGSQAFPGLDLGIDLGSGFKVFGNVGSTWRIPTYTDLYYEDPANLGNPDLKPETAVTTETGIKWKRKTIDIQFSAFRRKSENLIDWTKEEENDPWFPSNIGEVVVKGVEWHSSLNFNKKSTHYPILTMGYTYLSGENLSDAPLSRYALDLISHQMVAGIRQSLAERIWLDIQMKYVDRLSLDNYTVFDSRISINLHPVDIGIFGNNIFNQSYTETNLVPMPGRWLGIDVTYSQ